MSESNRFRFTKAAIASLPVPAKPTVYYDDMQRGLGLRVQPSGKKVFFVQKQARGTLQRKTLGTFGEASIEQARAEAMETLSAVIDWKRADYEGRSPLAGPEETDALTFGDAFEQYVRGAVLPRAQSRGKDPAKAEQRVRQVFKYCEPLKNRDVIAIAPADVVKLHRKLSEPEGPKAHGGPIMANRAVEIVRSVFGYLQSKGLVGSDPSKAVTMNRETKRTRFLQPHELKPFFDALEAEPNVDVADFVALLLATGVRKSNLYGARWADIDFTLGQWTIPGEQSKNGQALTVELVPKAIKILRARKARTNGSPWVFPSSESASGHTIDFKNQYKRILKRAGLAGEIRMHDLRRTCGSYQAIAGASLPVIGASLGHANAASTEIYARMHNAAVRQSLLDGAAVMERMQRKAARESKRLLTNGR